MNERTIQFRIGLFVLAALIVLGVLVTLFGSFPRVFTGRDSYSILFPSAPGVGPGTPVRRLGVRVGEVEDVQIEDSQVRVRIAVDRSQQLKDNEVPILTQGMLGDAAIDFRPRANGKVQPQPLAPGAELIGVVQVDLLTKAGELAPQIGDSLTEIGGLARDSRKAVPELEKAGQEVRLAARNWGSLGERLNVLVRTNEDKLIKTLESLNKTLEDISRVFSDENVRNLNATLKNAKGASDNFGAITKNADEAIKRLNDAMTKADTVLTNLQQASKPLAERSGSVMKNLDESTAKLDKVLSELREILRLVGQEDSTVRRLITDPSLYQNLDDAACMVTKILPRLDRILKDMEIFADKLARHPESLGIGGVVRPGSGIK